MIVFDLKSLRNSAGLSQVGLAHESGVSLPTIQNIESEKANITMQVLDKLTHVLGIEIKLASAPFAADLAVILGVPLLIKNLNSTETPNKQSLIIEARKWIHLLQNGALEEREELAVVSFLMAVKDHYPSFYRNFLKAPVFEEKISSSRKDGRAIKLRRISLANISRYL